MAESRFVLQFDVSEIPRLAARYVVDDQGADDEALRAGREISSGSYSRDSLQVIFRWKEVAAFPGSTGTQMRKLLTRCNWLYELLLTGLRLLSFVG
jgi:hypothetical protein